MTCWSYGGFIFCICKPLRCLHSYRHSLSCCHIDNWDVLTCRQVDVMRRINPTSSLHIRAAYFYFAQFLLDNFVLPNRPSIEHDICSMVHHLTKISATLIKIHRLWFVPYVLGQNWCPKLIHKSMSLIENKNCW